MAFNNRTNTPVVNVYEFDKGAALSEHRPNHQMTFLKQELVDKYLTFVESIEL